MGFFKNLFKRKPGGTFFGNLLRGASNKLSGGILGNGAGLAKWEEKQAQQQQQAAFNQQQEQLQKSRAFQMGQGLAQPYSSDTQRLIDKAKDEAKKNWLQENWWKLALGVGGLALVMWLIMNNTGKNRR